MHSVRAIVAMPRKRLSRNKGDTVSRKRSKPIPFAPEPAFDTGAYDRADEGEWHWFETRDARQYDEALRIKLRRGDLVSVLVDTGAQDTKSLDEYLLSELRGEPMLVQEKSPGGLVLRDRCEWGLGLRYKLVAHIPV